jgi:hypothetical protein
MFSPMKRRPRSVLAIATGRSRLILAWLIRDKPVTAWYFNDETLQSPVPVGGNLTRLNDVVGHFPQLDVEVL